MDIFKLQPQDEKHFHLNVETYHRETSKKWPYYQKNRDGKTLHYATCPGCNNPIHIVNLDVSDKTDTLGRPLTLFAKHAQTDVSGIAVYNEKAYRECPLANPEAFTGNGRRSDGKSASEIIEIICSHADLIENEIRRATGIVLTEDSYTQVLSGFRAQDGHLYKSVTKFNLPYGILYMSQFTDIINANIRSQEIRSAFNGSKYFYITDHNNVWRKKGAYGARIGVFFTRHVMPKDNESPQTIMMVIEEHLGQEKNTIFEDDIRVDNAFFFNAVCKRNRVWRIARSIFGKLQPEATRTPGGEPGHHG